MNLIVPGNISIKNKNAPGGVVFTPNAIFLFFASFSTVAGGAAVGGLVGALIGMGVSKAMEKKEVKKQSILQEPELQSLTEKEQKHLRNINRYYRIDKSNLMSIQQTWTGMKFLTGDDQKYSISSLAKKKQMREYLYQNGYHLTVR